MREQQSPGTAWLSRVDRIGQVSEDRGCILVLLGIGAFLLLMLLPPATLVGYMALQAGAGEAAVSATGPQATPAAAAEVAPAPTEAALASAEEATVSPTLSAYTEAVQAASGEVTAYAPDVVAAGETAFASLCAACHGADARGLPNLGLNLVESAFVRSLSDTELRQFIIMGRPIWDPANTTGVDMPPRGGNPALSNEDILAIIAYLRVLSGQGVISDEPAGGEAAAAAPTATTPEPLPTQRPTLAEVTYAPPTAIPSAEGAGGDGGAAGDYDPALIAAGETAFASLCAACHGADARGLPNLGLNLVESAFVRSLSDTELRQFIIMGRPIWDPANTTGVDMPPRGGNPALSNEDILAIIAYIRSLAASQ